MLISDCHMHTNSSIDSEAKMEDMICQAVELGLSEIAITDHIDFLYREKPFPHQIDYCKYKDNFGILKEKYKNKISIVFGAEIGVNEYSNETVNNLISGHGFDFIIASSHDIYGTDLYHPEFYTDKNKEYAYNMYFENVLSCVSNIDKYCVFGHLDYISRYGRYPDPLVDYEYHRDIIDKIIKKSVANGKGFEVNTSGYRYNINTIYPSFEILKRYKELGGEILTLGSDAHRPEDIAHRFGDAIAMIKAAGFKALCRFKNLQPIFYDI